MIYNLIAFLRAIYTDVTFYVNETRLDENDLPERYCVIREYDGKDKPAYEDQYFQVKVHDIDSARAKILAEELYYTMINSDGRGSRNNLTLPQVYVKSILYPAILISSIQALQKPSFLGIDDNGRAIYDFNLWLIKEP
jgi:hypothetical protein